MELKPRIVRLAGRWFVKSAPWTPDEPNAEFFWEYWQRYEAAIGWCFRMNEDQAWLQWAGRAKRGN